MGTVTRGCLPVTYLAKTVAGVWLEHFSELMYNFKKWYDTSIIHAYDVYRHQFFLDEELLCTKYNSISANIKCSLSISKYWHISLFL